MKKRILSLILALSMVLSVLPLGAFAAGSNHDLVMERAASRSAPTTALPTAMATAGGTGTAYCI